MAEIQTVVKKLIKWVVGGDSSSLIVEKVMLLREVESGSEEKEYW